MKNSSTQPHLAILSTASKIGGMERIVCGLSREFTNRNWRVHTIFPVSEHRNALLQWCHNQGVNAKVSDALLDAADMHDWGSVERLRNYIRQLQPDVVNIHFGDNFISFKDMIAIRSAGNHRCVVTVHHPTPWQETSWKKRLMTALASRLAHEVVTVSKASYTILRQAAIPSKRLHIIPCGLQPPPQMVDRHIARRNLGLPMDSLLIGSLGRLVPHKGIDDLIKAVANVAATRKQVYLVIAGTGPEQTKLEELASRLLPEQCVFLGRVPDINEYLAALDIFALPSHMEGFGLVYVEAAFHGVPSVATTVGGIPDAVIDKKTGLLVPVGDIAALSAILGQLCDDPILRHQLGKAAQARANTELIERIQADRYEKIFRNYWEFSTAVNHFSHS